MKTLNLIVLVLALAVPAVSFAADSTKDREERNEAQRIERRERIRERRERMRKQREIRREQLRERRVAQREVRKARCKD